MTRQDKINLLLGIQTGKINIKEIRPVKYDLSKLTDDELRTIIAIQDSYKLGEGMTKEDVEVLEKISSKAKE